MLDQIRAAKNILAQESDMVWIYRDGEWIFRVRRRLGDELKVEKIPMNHSVPLKYEFLKLHNMCPEALQIGEQCVIRQLSILLKEPAENLSREFDTIFESYVSHPPFNGTGWRTVGISTEMICDFAEKRGINLHVFHGNK